MYAQTVDQALRGTGTETFEAIDMLRKADPSRFQPENGAEYPTNRVGQALQQIAQLLKADVGLEVAFVDSGGWDNHVNEGGAQGQLSNLLRDLGQALAAFHQDMGDRMEDVVVVTHVRIRPHRARKRQSRHRSRPRQLHVCDGRRGERRESLRQVARTGPEQLNEGRDLAAHHRFSLRARRNYFASIWAQRS